MKAQVIKGVLTGFVTGIRKDSVRRWNLWFPSAGVFAEVLAGRATGTQITFHPLPACDRQTDRQIDMLPIAKSCSSIGECDKN